MSSWIRCSARRLAPASAALAVLAAAVLAAGCAHRERGPAPAVGVAPAGERLRVLLLPIDNLAATAAPTKELLRAIEAALGDRLEFVSGAPLERFLSRHRVRFTGGIDGAAARAAREELDADAVLVTSLELYRPEGPPMLGLAVRLVSTGEQPEILWMDTFARSGDQAPGVLGLGLVNRIEEVQRRVIDEVSGALGGFLAGEPPGAGCDGATRYRPRVRFRSQALDTRDSPTVAVLPFLNRSARRGAGQIMELEFVRQLVASGRFRVLEPGVVRDYLLRARVIMPGGVSLESTRLVVGEFGADLVLSGVVLDYDESTGPKGPTIGFSATLLERNGGIAWMSRSTNRGDDGVLAFGLGRVRTAPHLTCRMVAEVVEGMNRPGGTAVAWTPRKWERDPGPFMRDPFQPRARSGSGNDDAQGNGTTGAPAPKRRARMGPAER